MQGDLGNLKLLLLRALVLLLGTCKLGELVLHDLRRVLDHRITFKQQLLQCGQGLLTCRLD